MTFSSSARAFIALVVCAHACASRAGEPISFGEEVLVQGRKDRPADLSAAATVVDARKFAGESKTVAELVSTAPGVAVNEYGGLGQLSTITIRGSNADAVQVFLDGLPLNSAGGGGVDLSRIPHAWIDRIEVVRGAASAAYGPGALGGAVHITTRRAAVGHGSAEATAGSFGTYSAAADGALGGEHWGLFLSGALDTTRGDFPYVLDTQQALTGNATTALTRQHNASTSGGGLTKFWSEFGANRIDAILQLSGGKRDLPGTSFHATPDDGQSDLRTGMVVRLSRPLSETLDLELGLNGREDDLNVRVSPYAEARQRDHAAEVSARLLWATGLNALTLHVSGSTEGLDTENDKTHTRSGLSLAFSDTLTLASGRFRLDPVFRWDRQGDFDGVSAKLGAVYQLSDLWSVRAGGGHTLRIPSFGELYLQQGLLMPNPDLVPEEGWSADGALVANGRLGLFSLGAFAQLFQNLVVWEQIAMGRAKPYNDGKASALGLELEAATAPLGPQKLTLSGAYTYLSTESLRGDRGIIGKSLPHRAPHRLFARLGVAPGRLEAHGEAHYVSGQYLSMENTSSLYAPAALTFNLGGSWLLSKRLETRLHLEVRNLLDDRSLQDGFGNPLPGRMLLVTIRVTG